MAKTKKKQPPKHWQFWLPALPLFGCALILGMALSVLNHAGENLSPDDVVDKLSATNGLYGPALSPHILAFKEQLYERFTPDTVVLGSARLDQMRADDFAVPFVNLSGSKSLDEVADLCAALFDKLKPKAVILAPDDAWFLSGEKTEAAPRAPEAEKSGAHDLATLAGWFAAGNLTFGDLKTILSGDLPNIGINAILHGDGYDKGGAFTDASLWRGVGPSEDKAFKTSLDAIAKGADGFAWADAVDPARWQKFSDLLDFLQKRGIKTFILLPPAAPTVLDAMTARGKYGYVDALRLKMSELAAADKMPLFDDHDLRFAGASNCEFIDGLHPGAIAMRRLLLDMAVKDPDMRARLKLSEIGWSIEHFKGHASALPDEADFLALGCKKPAAP